MAIWESFLIFHPTKLGNNLCTLQSVMYAFDKLMKTTTLNVHVRVNIQKLMFRQAPLCFMQYSNLEKAVEPC